MSLAKNKKKTENLNSKTNSKLITDIEKQFSKIQIKKTHRGGMENDESTNTTRDDALRIAMQRFQATPNIPELSLMQNLGSTNREFSTAWAEDNQRLRDFAGAQIIPVVDNDIASQIAWNSDGSHIAIASYMNRITIYRYVTSQWQQIGQFNYNDNRMIMGMKWSPDNRFIASTSNHTIRIWSLETMQQIHEINLHPVYIHSLSWSPNQRYLLSGGSDNIIYVWDTNTWQNIGQLNGHTHEVKDITCNNDGTFIASCSFDNTVRIWSVENWQQVALLTHPNINGGLFSIAWKPDGTQIASSNGYGTNNIYIWNGIAPYQFVRELTGHQVVVGKISWSSNGSRLASESLDRTVRIWDTRTWETIRTIRFPDTREYPLDPFLGIRTIVWNPAPNSNRLAISVDDHRVHILAIDMTGGSNNEKHTYKGRKYKIRISLREKKYILVGSEKKKVYVK